MGGRVAGVTAAMKKESSDRKKEITQLKSNLSQTQQMAAIMPLLTQGQSVTLTNALGNLPVGTKVMVDSGNMLNLMMPMLMYSSIGDGGSATATGGGGLFGGGGGDGMGGMMPMFMIMALSGSLGSR